MGGHPVRRSGALDLVGLVPAACVLLRLAGTPTPISVAGAVAIGALAVVGTRTLRPAAWLLAAPAALAVAATAPYRASFVPLLVAIVVWRGAVSMARLDDELRDTPTVPILFALSAAGAYACLPDTERIIPLAIVAVLTAAVALPWPRPWFGGPGAMALVGLSGWISAAGGVGRTAATIGALGSLGVLLLAGLGRRRNPLALVAVQAGCVVVCSRVAGVAGSVGFASFVVVGTLTVAAVLVYVLTS
jgi:hypothetical protein